MAIFLAVIIVIIKIDFAFIIAIEDSTFTKPIFHSKFAVIIIILQTNSFKHSVIGVYSTVEPTL